MGWKDAPLAAPSASKWQAAPLANGVQPAPMDAPQPEQYLGAEMSPGAGGNNPMAQGTPEPAPPLSPDDNWADPISAGFTRGLNAIPIAGPSLLNGANALKAKVWGTTPEAIAADNSAIEERQPGAATTGTVAGAVLPYLAAGAYEVPATALGLTGSLLSRLILGTGSQFAINTADNMTRQGDDLPTAAKDAILPTAIAAPFGLLGKGKAPSAAVKEAADVLDAAGVPLTGGQRSGSKGLKIAENELGGGTGEAFGERQGEEFTRAALKTAGIDAKRATPAVIDQAFKDIGGKFDSLAARTTVPFDQQLQSDLLKVATDYEQTTGSPAKVVENIINRAGALAQGNNGRLTGESYQTLRSELGRLSQSGAPETRGALHDLQSALDDAVERHMPARFVNEWRTIRRQYQNLLTVRNSVTGAGPEAVSGIITPGHLRQADLAVQGKSGYARGAGDLNELVRAGVTALTPLANTNTAARLAVRGAAAAPSAIAGALLGNSVGGALGAGAGSLAGLIGPSVLGRLLMSGPGRLISGSRGTMLPNALARALANDPSDFQ